MNLYFVNFENIDEPRWGFDSKYESVYSTIPTEDI